MVQKYKQQWLPLESDPAIFNSLIKSLGIPSSLHFDELFSLNELSLTGSPQALILVFPTPEDYEMHKAGLDETYVAPSDVDGFVWFEQTIDNACGLYAILHAVVNGVAHTQFSKHSLFGHLLQNYLSFSPQNRPLVLENSRSLQEKYDVAARQGSSEVPEIGEEVDFHYTFFVKSLRNQHLYELDGDRKGPIDTGLVLGPDEDVLSERSLARIQTYIKDIQTRQANTSYFQLMALMQVD